MRSEGPALHRRVDQSRVESFTIGGTAPLGYPNLGAPGELAFDHANHDHHAPIGIVVGVEDERP